MTEYQSPNKNKKLDIQQRAVNPDLPVMNNSRLNKFSEKFMSDDKSQVEKRCFFLFAGQDLNTGSAFSLDLTLTKNDAPRQNLFVNVDIHIDNLTCEQCSDVIVSLTKIVPDFRIMFMYDDLFVKPKNLDIDKKVRYQAVLYYLRNQIIKHRPFKDSAVLTYQNELLAEKNRKAIGGFETTRKEKEQ